MKHEDLFALAQSLVAANRREEAVNVLTAILLQDPESTVAWCERGALVHMLGRPFDAILNFDRGIALGGRTAALLNNRGASLLVLGEFEAAHAAFTAATVENPDFDRAWINVALACRRLGRWEEALDAYRRAVTLSPHDPEIHFGIAHSCLALGEWEEGWREYLAWRRIEGSAGFNRALSGRRWEGQDLRGQTIAVIEEQGFGDTIHFARYLPMLARRAAKVTFAVRRHIAPLITASMPEVEVVPSAAGGSPTARYVASLIDLPRLFLTRPDTIPAEVPYLHADAGLRAEWRRRLAGLPGARKIGLCWAGGRRELVRHHAAMDAERSMALAQLAPLADIPGICWVALQTDDFARAQIGDAVLPLFDPADEIVDFSDTAALIAELDLVISVDTAVLHLAGALARPAWLMNRHDGDWRWMYGREDSPWYPTLRIFRQPQPGDWAAVVDQVRAALAAYSAG